MNFIRFINAFLLLAMSAIAYAQPTFIDPYKIEISSNKTTHIIFPFSIKSVDRGSLDVLAQKSPGADAVLQLKADHRGIAPTNVTVITADNKLYSFLVVYDSVPQQLTLSFDSASSVLNKSVLPISDNTAQLTNGGRPDVGTLQTEATMVAGKKKKILRLHTSHGLIYGRLTAIYIKNDVYYFLFKIKNESNVSYSLESVSFIIQDVKRMKRKATQEKVIQPLFQYGTEKAIQGHQQGNWVIAVPKFTLEESKHLHIQILEGDGGRNLSFIIQNKHLLAAKNYKRPFLKSFSTIKKLNGMNTENLNYLRGNLKYHGFGEKLYPELEQRIKEGQPQFQLQSSTSVNGKTFEAILNFRKADQSDMYFFNSYAAKLDRGIRENIEQTFYINKGGGITSKEAYNLLDGRAVYKELTSKEGAPYQAWIQLDPAIKDKNGNYILNHYHSNYGFDLGKSLVALPIKELATDEGRSKLIKSLEKGNVQAVMFEQKGKEERMFIEANPKFKTLNVYDGGMKRVKKTEVNKETTTSSHKQEKKVQKTNSATMEKKKAPGKSADKTMNGKETKLLHKKRTSKKTGLTP